MGNRAGFMEALATALGGVDGIGNVPASFLSVVADLAENWFSPEGQVRVFGLVEGHSSVPGKGMTLRIGLANIPENVFVLAEMGVFTNDKEKLPKVTVCGGRAPLQTDLDGVVGAAIEKAAAQGELDGAEYSVSVEKGLGTT